MKRALRWLGIGLGAVVGLVVLLAIVLYFVGSSKVNREYDVTTANLNLVNDSASLARGAHLTGIYGCVDCHAANFAGQVFADAPPFRVVASNLTSGRGGVGSQYTPALFDRAIRHGVGADGKALFIMPSAAFHRMSDQDAADIITYLMQLPPVDNELPPTEFRPLGRVLSAFALDPAFEVNTEPAAKTSPPVGPTLEYGRYLTGGICAYCHGADLRGMQPPNPDSPPAPDLSPVGRWSFDQLRQTLRTGVTPDGRNLNPEVMPWSMTARMTDDELRAVHMSLASLAGGQTTAAR